MSENKRYLETSLRSDFNAILTEETLKGLSSPTAHPGESFTKSVFSQEVNDMCCRIGRTMRQASGVHPKLTIAIARTHTKKCKLLHLHLKKIKKRKKDKINRKGVVYITLPVRFLTQHS